MIDGIKFPYRTTKTRNGTKLAEITVEQIKLNAEIKPADLSVKPPDLKPVMAKTQTSGVAP